MTAVISSETPAFTSSLLASAANEVPDRDHWGTLLSQGYEHMFQSWSEVTFPGIAIIVSVLGINLLGDALSDAIDPRQWSR